jgi:hypothetical protein
VVGGRGDTTLVPPSAIKLDLRAGAKVSPAAGAGSPAPGAGKSGAYTSGVMPTSTPASAPIGSKARARQSSGASWWTARATAGEVKAGFTKEEILKPPKEDPTAPGGVFTRVRGLLAELAGIQ